MSRCRTSWRRSAVTTPDERARAVGAANTLWYDGDTLRSTNTDVEGFLANLDSATPGWDRGLESALVLGAGGGARAAVFALLTREVQRVYVINRTRDRAEELRKQFGARMFPAAWEEITGLLGGAGLLVNTTTLGMAGQPPLEVNLRCPASLVVADLVYDPLIHAALGGRARAGPAHRRRSRHAAAPGGARLRIVVRRAPGSDGGIARAGRGRSRRDAAGAAGAGKAQAAGESEKAAAE